MDEAEGIAYFRADEPRDWLDWAAHQLWLETDFAEHGRGAAGSWTVRCCLSTWTGHFCPSPALLQLCGADGALMLQLTPDLPAAVMAACSAHLQCDALAAGLQR